MSSKDLENVRPYSSRANTVTLDIEPAKPRQENIFATDYYEILRIAPHADEDTIERVYRTLADRFHPDNPGTGDPETFLRLREAYETLSNPARRATYNASRQNPRGSGRFWLRGREFFDGVRGGQNRRLAVLCLLYRQRISTHESPGLTMLDLERLTGCTREELSAALWYLREKKWSAIGEFSAYTITVDGFDVVESKLEDRLELRALATVCYYDLPAGPEDPAHVEPRFWKSGMLPLDIEPSRTIDGDAFIADLYEILGVSPQADQDDIERVYRTLATRFHPDNPSTGDAKTFQRIREAYETLSDEDKRAQYDALRQRTRYSERFRLRGREFFDGIRGEQLRRLAVLCLLYRQGASELPGLTVLDLEQLTGCTREELGSALWYLREKKWATSGEFTEYSITAAGFDVVENKMEDREAARSRAWVDPEDTRGNEIVFPQLSPVEPAVESQQNVPVMIAGSEQTDIQAVALPENAEVAQGPTPSEEAPGPIEEGSRLEVGAEPAAIALENQSSHRIAETEQTEIKAGEPPEDNMKVAQGPIPIEETSGPIEQSAAPAEQEAARSWAWLYAEDADSNDFTSPQQSQRNVPVTPQFPTSNTSAAENQNGHRTAESEQTDSKAGDPSDEQRAVASGPAQVEDAPVPAKQGTRFEVASQSPGVSRMSNSEKGSAAQAGGVAVRAEKRVIFSMGGKGGVGKTNVMTGLAEWFEENQIPVTLLDLDTENKAKGSLTHFFGGRVPKINIHTPAGLDAFVDILAEDAPAILADMGAGAGKITHDWFDKMYPDVTQVGIVFTAIGVVTSDPASVESVLNWGAALQDRVDYVIVENHLTEHADFTYWRDNDQAEEFRRRFHPAILQMDCRLADLENAARNYGVTLGRVAGRTAPQPELQKASLVMRAQSYRRRMFAEFDKVKELLLP